MLLKKILYEATCTILLDPRLGTAISVNWLIYTRKFEQYGTDLFLVLKVARSSGQSESGIVVVAIQGVLNHSQSMAIMCASLTHIREDIKPLQKVFSRGVTCLISSSHWHIETWKYEHSIRGLWMTEQDNFRISTVLEIQSYITSFILNFLQFTNSM